MRNYILNKITAIPRISFVGRENRIIRRKLPKSRTRFITNSSIEYTLYGKEFNSQFEWLIDIVCICKLDSNQNLNAASMHVLYLTNILIYIYFFYYDSLREKNPDIEVHQSYWNYYFNYFPFCDVSPAYRSNETTEGVAFMWPLRVQWNCSVPNLEIQLKFDLATIVYLDPFTDIPSLKSNETP